LTEQRRGAAALFEKPPEKPVDIMEYQKRAQTSLERIWKAYNARFDTIGYDLVIMAVPRFPSNIEAISRGQDVETLVEVMEAFLAQFKANQGVSDGDGTDHKSDGERGADGPDQADAEGSS
jgi:hypothetical protein